MNVLESSASGLLTQAVAMHKFHPPAPLAGAVYRERILDDILGDDAPPVVCVQAPAGYGKTTLLQQARERCEERQEIIGWLRLDEADNDRVRLLTHLHALVRAMAEQANGAQVEDDDGAAAGGHQSSRPDWMINLLQELDRPMAIFLDEFQALTEPAGLELFACLLENLPDGIRVFIGSRGLPGVNLSRLTVSERAAVLRAEDLRFTVEEVRQFFAAASELELAEEDAVAVHRHTEGWPAAVQLYRLALVDPDVRASLSEETLMQPRQLADYLADNVLRRQTSDIQSFLLHSAPLSRLGVELCDQVLQRDDSQAMLQSLEAAGLFLQQVDAEGKWFRYHSLFASMLAEQFRRDQPDALARIHARAERWFRDHGLSEDAMVHACARGDFASAAANLERWVPRLVAKGNMRTIERWYERLPAAEIGRHPDLVVLVAYALIFLHRQERLRPLLAIVEGLSEAERKQMWTQPEIMQSMAAIISHDDVPAAAEFSSGVAIEDPDASGFRAFELAAAANLKGFLALATGEFEQAREALSWGRAYSDRDHARFSGGYAIGTQGMNFLMQARTREALDLLASGASRVDRWPDDSLSAAVVVSCYVAVLYEVGRFDEALRHFEQYRQVIVDAAGLDYLVVSIIAVARIHHARGHLSEASKILDEGELVGRRRRWQRLVQIVGWERVRQSLVAGDVARARRLAEQLQGGESRTAAWRPFSEDANDALIGQIRLAAHDGDSATALELIGQARLAMSEGCVRRRIKLLVLEALARQVDGHEAEALEPLRAALALAAPANLIRTFLEEGGAIPGLLKEGLSVANARQSWALPAGPTRVFSEAILAAAGLFVDAAAANGQIEALTERESAILQRLTMGESNKAIAKSLFVSENTVKFHLKNVYSKLGVTSRLQAIGVGRDLGLI